MKYGSTGLAFRPRRLPGSSIEERYKGKDDLRDFGGCSRPFNLCSNTLFERQREWPRRLFDLSGKTAHQKKNPRLVSSLTLDCKM